MVEKFTDNYCSEISDTFCKGLEACSSDASERVGPYLKPYSWFKLCRTCVTIPQTKNILAEIEFQEVLMFVKEEFAIAFLFCDAFQTLPFYGSPSSFCMRQHT